MSPAREEGPRSGCPARVCTDALLYTCLPLHSRGQRHRGQGPAHLLAGNAASQPCPTPASDAAGKQDAQLPGCSVHPLKLGQGGTKASPGVTQRPHGTMEAIRAKSLSPCQMLSTTATLLGKSLSVISLDTTLATAGRLLPADWFSLVLPRDSPSDHAGGRVRVSSRCQHGRCRAPEMWLV